MWLALVPDEGAVEQLVADCADPSLGEGVGSGSSGWHGDDRPADCCEGADRGLLGVKQARGEYANRRQRGGYADSRPHCQAQRQEHEERAGDGRAEQPGADAHQSHHGVEECG